MNNQLEIMRLLLRNVGMAPGGGNGGGSNGGNLPIPAAQQATLPGASAGLARQPVGQPGCGTMSLDGSPVLTGPVRGCQQDVPIGCSGGAALRLATLDSTVVPATGVAITIEPSQMLYMTKLTLFVRRTAGILAGTGVLVEVEYDDQTVFPRHTPKEYDIEAFSLEAQRAGLNPLPGGMPLFTRDRPMLIRYKPTGPAIPVNESIVITGVATLASPTMDQLAAQILG